MDVEATLAKHTAARAVFVGPVLIGIFWAFRGTDGAWAAALGVAIVVANFLLSGAMLSTAARISPSLYHAAALFGFFVRLAMITLTLVVVLRFIELDKLAFGISLAVAYMVLLGWEAVAIAQGSEREMDWTS